MSTDAWFREFERSENQRLERLDNNREVLRAWRVNQIAANALLEHALRLPTIEAQVAVFYTTRDTPLRDHLRYMQRYQRWLLIHKDKLIEMRA